MTYSLSQLQAADAIDELKVGEGVDFSNGIYVERVSPTRFRIDGDEMCFIQACDVALKGL